MWGRRLRLILHPFLKGGEDGVSSTFFRGNKKPQVSKARPEAPGVCGMSSLDFHDDGEDEGAAACGFLDEALEVVADLLFDDAVVLFLFRAGAFERA